MKLVYLDSFLSSSNFTSEGSLISDTEKFSLDKHGIDMLRKSLAHPFHMVQSSIRCIVISVNGFDGADATERLIVASHLWAAGISAEYMTQSGVVNSLLKETREELQGSGTSVSRDCALLSTSVLL